LDGATALFVEAAEHALDAASLRPEDVDAIVTVSSAGIATPTLEARATQTMGFRADIHRVPVFGTGCAGGVTGLALAARLARASPGSNVLMVSVEACTLSFRSDRCGAAIMMRGQRQSR
jgi:alkylresorcinol/alkylpyrone synthase